MPQLRPRCRLYLQVAAPLTAKLQSWLSKAIVEVSPACVLVRGAPSDFEAGALDALIDRIQGPGAACLLENNIEAAADLGADGVHIEADPELYQKARQILGESASIGVGCGLAQHEAMVLAESGADYVAFEDTSGEDFETLGETIAWWSEIFVVPSVAWNIRQVDQAKTLTERGVDFIAPPSALFEDDEAVELLSEMDRVIGTIRRDA